MRPRETARERQRERERERENGVDGAPAIGVEFFERFANFPFRQIQAKLLHCRHEPILIEAFPQKSNKYRIGGQD